MINANLLETVPHIISNKRYNTFEKTDTLIEYVFIADTLGVLKKVKVLHIILKYKNPPTFREIIGDWYIDYSTKKIIKKEDMIPSIFTHIGN